jgi:hypothetical protein
MKQYLKFNNVHNCQLNLVALLFGLKSIVYFFYASCSYYFKGTTATYKDYLDPEHFAHLLSYIARLKSIVSETQYPNVSLWLGETSDAYNSGTKNVSDRFVSGFL